MSTINQHLHPRNRHRERYNIPKLVETFPPLGNYIKLTPTQEQTIDFSNPKGVKALNQALLKEYYDIHLWDIPAGYLCPPVPGRADYLHYLADLLAASSSDDTIPKGKSTRILDLGVGANCIYPIIGVKEYGWSFVGSEVDDLAYTAAQNIVAHNKGLKKNVDIRFQRNHKDFFKNIILENEFFNAVICNPPFHASSQEAHQAAVRKTRNLKKDQFTKKILNFGGESHELWTPGGEAKFLKVMIQRSRLYHKQVGWFTSLVSKKENLRIVRKEFQRAAVKETRTIDMKTGNKTTRIVCWKF